MVEKLNHIFWRLLLFSVVAVILTATPLTVSAFELNSTPQDPVKALAWGNPWGGPYFDEAYGVSTAASGIYVAGTTTIAGAGDAFLLKYDATGNLKWEKSWGTLYHDGANDVAASDSGIYVVGWKQGYISTDAFLSKYDVDGTLIWERFITYHDADERAYGVFASATEIYVVGNIGNIAFIAKYDVNGNELWRNLWGFNIATATDVTVSADGVYVTGDIKNTLGNFDAFLLKYDANGNLKWERFWGGDLTDEAFGVATSADGKQIYVVGRTESFGAGGYDAFILKYDKDGGLTWEKIFGGTSDDGAYGVALAGTYILMAGYTKSYGAGMSDFLLLALDTSGKPKGGKVLGGSDNDEARAVAVSLMGVYVAGGTYSAGAGDCDALLLRLL